MKYSDVVARIATARAFWLSTWTILTLLSLLLLLDPNYHGLKGVYALMMKNGKTLIQLHEKH
tara:strand:- start:761 stop:946 length:186 start_codon:yes stop_codon:yes gene_type:complete